MNMTQIVWEKRTIQETWVLVVTRKLLEQVYREFTDRGGVMLLENDTGDLIEAQFLDCVRVSQARIVPQIPAMLTRFESTYKHRFTEEKRAYLLTLAEKLLSNAFALTLLDTAKRDGTFTAC